MMVADASAADAQVRSFVDRIIRLHEEKAAIVGDIKDVFAELKGTGLDKTALGALVRELMRDDKAGEAEKAALLDLYRTAYERASRTHAREAA